MRFVRAIRLVTPVALGALAAGWLLGRSERREIPPLGPAPHPDRPWLTLALQLVAFGLTAAASIRLLGPGAPPLSVAGLSLIVSCLAVTALVAAALAAPLNWFGAKILTSWRLPLVALAFGILSWRAASAAEGLWGLLSAGTLRASAWVLRIAPYDLTLDPARNILGLGGFVVHVAPVCSGADGIGLVLLFQATWIALARRQLRLGRALLLLPFGALAALAANVVRLSALIWFGASGHSSLAAGGLHSKLGWVLFTAIALGTIAVADRMRWLRREAAEASEEIGGMPPAAAAYVAPLIATLATALATSMTTEGALDAWYFARALAGAGALFLVRGSLPRASFPSSPAVPVVIAAVVAVVWISWSPQGGGEELASALARIDPATRWAWIAARVIGSCTVIPVVEELAFRGFFLRWLVSPEFDRLPSRAWTWPALILSSLAFGAIHEQWILGTFAGLAFGVARLWRGRLSDAIFSHALANAAIAAAVLLSGRWGLWGS